MNTEYLQQIPDDPIYDTHIDDSAIPETAGNLPLSFLALSDPCNHVPSLISKLKLNAEFRFYLTALSVEDLEDNILDEEIWADFTVRIAASVKDSFAIKKSSIHKCKSSLLIQEELIMKSWSKKYAAESLRWKDGFDAFAFLTTIAEIFLALLHQHMCNGLPYSLREMDKVVNDTFCSNASPIEAFQSTRLQESLYYIAGWLVCAARKESRRRKKTLQVGLALLVSQASLADDEMSNTNISLPNGKVQRTERFGGLVYVTEAFYLFVLRLELVFKKILVPEYLAVCGSMVIARLYDALKKNPAVHTGIRSIIQCEETADSSSGMHLNDTLVEDIVAYLARTYCRMRGKDNVRKLLSHSGKQHNSQKTIRSVLTAKSCDRKQSKESVKISDSRNNVQTREEEEYIVLMEGILNELD